MDSINDAWALAVPVIVMGWLVGTRFAARWDCRWIIARLQVWKLPWIRFVRCRNPRSRTCATGHCAEHCRALCGHRCGEMKPDGEKAPPVSTASMPAAGGKTWN